MRKSPRKRAPVKPADPVQPVCTFCRRSHVPNALTAKVLRDSKAGKGLKSFETLEELLADLGM
jgi:hypothetical protein